jgi:hypothetical protein
MSMKIVAVLTALVGGLGIILSAAEAFGLDLSANQSEAIIGLGSLFLLVLGAWLHPDVPLGNQNP